MRKGFLFSSLLIICTLLYSQTLYEAGSWEYGPTEAIAIKDSTAYINSGSYMWVIDVSDEANPTLLNEYKLEDNIQSIRRLGNYLYVCKHDSVVNIYSVHNQITPVLSGEIVLNPILIAGDISFKADTMFMTRLSQLTAEYYVNDTINPQIIRYILGSDTYFKQTDSVGMGLINKALSIYNMNEIGDVNYLSSVDFDETVRGVQKLGNYVYVGIGSQGIGIVDVSNIDSIRTVTEYATGGTTCDVELLDDTILIAGRGMAGIGIYDIEDDTILTLIGECETDGFVYELELTSGRVYAGARSGGLIIIDISDLTNPIELGHYESYGDFRGMDVRNDRLYAASADGGLGIYNIGAGSSLSLISRTYTRYISEDVSVDDSFAYIAEGDSGLTILDITDEYNPVIVGQMDITNFAKQVEKDGSLCILGCGRESTLDQGYIIVTDVTDKVNPILGDTILRNASEIRFVMDGDLLHCIGDYPMYRYYEIWNIISSDSVSMLSQLQEDGQEYFSLDVYNGYSFLTINSRDTLMVFDVSDPDSVFSISTIRNKSFGFRVIYNSGYLYELIDDWDIYAYDMADPYNPVEVDVYPLGLYAEDIVNNGEWMYLSVGGGINGNDFEKGRYGVRILRMSSSGIEKKEIKNIIPQMNVTCDYRVISIENIKENDIDVELIDVSGRYVDTIHCRKGITEYIPAKNGLYFLQAKQAFIENRKLVIIK